MEVVGGVEVNITMMSDNDGDTGCSKVSNVGATRAFSDIDIVTIKKNYLQFNPSQDCERESIEYD